MKKMFDENGNEWLDDFQGEEDWAWQPKNIRYNAIMIYWTSRTRDRFVVYHNDQIVGDYLTFDECYQLVMRLEKWAFPK